ncbi:hypothetical protein A3A84_02565 [Candidatus Collierbacteria bacterium RIFCSPLOWO2_01_FULL_50_23]|nr:MAG: hypothetical protein A3A84_02565 [Candidatus Collierbacteria bacterium RIFCSPLOWO2_01_FULL_50_23]
MFKPLSLLLVFGFALVAACTPGVPASPTPSVLETDEAPELPSWFSAVVYPEGPCAWETFKPGDLIYLGASGDDFHASLVTYGGSLAGASLIISLMNVDLQLSATSLPGEGKTAKVGWGRYVSVQIANCAGKYHYQAMPLGTVNRPEPSVCSSGYTEGLKPFPFDDSEILFERGDEQVILATNSSPEGALIHTVGDQILEVVTIDRTESENGIFKTVKIRGGALQVSIKTCGVSFFYKAAQRVQHNGPDPE